MVAWFRFRRSIANSFRLVSSRIDSSTEANSASDISGSRLSNLRPTDQHPNQRREYDAFHGVPPIACPRASRSRTIFLPEIATNLAGIDQPVSYLLRRVPDADLFACLPTSKSIIGTPFRSRPLGIRNAQRGQKRRNNDCLSHNSLPCTSPPKVTPKTRSGSLHRAQMSPPLF